MAAAPRDHERFAAGGRDAVHATLAAAIERQPRSQVSIALHAVEDGIQRAGAHPVSVPGQLVDHRLTEDRTLRRVMQDVQADKPV